MGGDDDRGLRLGDAVHEQAQELAAGKGIEEGERLVEQEQRGPLAEGERQRELGALPWRERRDSGPAVESDEQLARQVAVPAGVARRREVEPLSDRARREGE